MQKSLIFLLLSVGIASADLIFSDDFTSPGKPWTGSNFQHGAFGTIDAAGTSERSGGMRFAPAAGGTLASLAIPISQKVADLDRLTLSFDLSVTVNQPVTVRLESIDANGAPSGSLETTVHPATSDFYQRFAVELSTMKPGSVGKFAPLDPAIRVSFTLARAGELALDNLAYANPSYYVSAKGSETADGRSEASAFATPQRALDAAGPGDIILVMDGSYEGVPAAETKRPVATFVRAGRPAAWITLKNFPGHRPCFSAHGQQAIHLSKPRSAGDGSLA
jgi:hypothetical protein